METNVYTMDVEDNFIQSDYAPMEYSDAKVMLSETDDYSNSYKEETHGNSVTLFITVGVCIVLGIVLGIIFGRKSALK